MTLRFTANDITELEALPDGLTGTRLRLAMLLSTWSDEADDCQRLAIRLETYREVLPSLPFVEGLVTGLILAAVGPAIPALDAEADAYIAARDAFLTNTVVAVMVRPLDLSPPSLSELRR